MPGMNIMGDFAVFDLVSVMISGILTGMMPNAARLCVSHE